VHAVAPVEVHVNSALFPDVMTLGFTTMERLGGSALVASYQ
jgi:hypothetical protein